ncbi:acyl-CoA dehydrogenase domain-containing protein [[Leptolyngbya] sp. PCC 7376]|uniref:acyl-CoA dehydrogenase family protein n=1 Tax=[Leptolyngbya] sp. PCC 7376 TaxID=111781 RepID=UPI00029F11C1|nr:acyl-CoA dehydrogenase family protein [[Leptolyngbya] sp. PCC 7376]AFY40397.1 acyl-CoA dehydrogenase domain-containing protein [[Leptolyngbya] sp. PCC 7376]
MGQTFENQKDWLKLQTYLHNVVTPIAEELDQNPQVLGECLQRLGDRHLLGLKVTTEFGGSGFSSLEYGLAVTEIARASGMLAFLQTQHQSAAGMIARFGSDSQRQWLPQLVTGAIKIGVGFSHLRRSGEPMVQAIPTDDGYLLTGTIPWITGYGFFERAIAGATLPNGDELYGFIPLKQTKQNTGGKIDCGEPLPLAAMGMSQTVVVMLDQWQLTKDEILVIKPAGSIQKGDRKNVLKHGFFALGCAYGCLDFLQQKLEPSQFNPLKTRLTQLRDEMVKASQELDSNFEQQLALRIQVVAIAQEYAQIALISSGGAGNLLSHPAQRLYREALMFSVFGQTSTIRNATLQTLIG